MDSNLAIDLLMELKFYCEDYLFYAVDCKVICDAGLLLLFIIAALGFIWVAPL